MLFGTLLLASTASATCLHGLSKFKKRAEGAEGEVTVGRFGYTDTFGPLNWAALAPENEACKTGTNQSPINIDETIPLATEKPVIDIPEQPVELENLGTTVEVIVNGTTKFAGTDFRLKQFHFHMTAEHRVNEEFFPMEAHFVHEGVTDPNQLAVISVLFQLSTSAATPILSGLQPHLAAIASPGTKTAIEAGLDFTSLIEHVQTTDLFQYSGSLTTPPCSEGVLFLITKEPLDVDVPVFNEMKKIIGFNARYSQNSLGQQNLVAVAGLAGTEGQVVVDVNAKIAAKEAVAAGGDEPPTAVVAPVTKGQTITITEIQGQATEVVGVVVKRDRV
ncbi:alpha carbonic anhydrase [Lophiotrema nucula]|uniref:carbonic anhydrase n=1 Tax=Lophiotrema nucula TaxID=690887 RepID=A0A6A5YPY0_9PLEO|nr:alpha carbonic anhydrase [Lophiotrema nucula]